MNKLGALMVFVVGCSDGGGGGGGADAPSGSDAPGGSDAPRPTKTGLVFIQSYTAEQPPGTMIRGGSASASFSTAACPSETHGDCQVSSCSQTPAPVSAGTITITGAALPLSLVPTAAKTYPASNSTTQAYFTGGATVMFAAAGGDVPAFTLSLATPTRPTITAPAEPPSASPSLMVTRANPFAVSWTGGSGRVQVWLLGGGGSGPTVKCLFPASAGSGAVPASALAMLPVGQGSFAMAAISEAEITIGDYGVTAQGYYNAVWPDGSIVSGPTMVQ
ncbi:MAG: hypothetical protein H0T42_20895 [Deltaproteobacteria bacterium]|nr:hypothetical protein [Deltaproteobacteria bacterium]